MTRNLNSPLRALAAAAAAAAVLTLAAGEAGVSVSARKH